MSKETLIRVESVQKKFCTNLRKSLQYGLIDIASDLFGRRSSSKLRRGEFYAVNDVSFELRRGECLGLIGRNGAGKTTLLKMLNGLIKPDGGKITVRGRVGALIALGAGFNPLLSGRENIYVNGAILGLSKAEINAKLESIIEFAELRDFIEAPVQSYSSGMVVRLGFAVAVHCQPDSLLLDEVLAVGDAAFQAKCYNSLSKFRSRGIGFILVSHNLSSIDCFCDRVVYLKQGRSVYVGNTQTAISKFNRDMLQETNAPEGEKGEFQKTCGSGKVLIRRISFLDPAGTTITEMRAGEPVTLRVEYECADAEAVPTMLDIHIKDQAGVFFHDPRAVECPGLSGRGYIDVTFAAIPANNQRLFFSIALMGLGSWELFDWKCDVPLTVHGSSRTQGRIYLTFESKVVEKNDPCADAAVLASEVL
jgi:ABC-type polysaccharide/polyol phosphate transport system ATPase subunit